jgi:DNA primase
MLQKPTCAILCLQYLRSGTDQHHQTKQKIKDGVTCFDICEWQGIELGRGGYISCQKNLEKTPSCKVYEETFNCYSCGDKGDCISLYQEITKEKSFNEACKAIAIHFDIDCAMVSTNEYRKAREKDKEIENQKTIVKKWISKFTKFFSFVFEIDKTPKEEIDYLQWAIEILQEKEQSVHSFDYLIGIENEYLFDSKTYVHTMEYSKLKNQTEIDRRNINRYKQKMLVQKLNKGELGLWV